MHGGWGGADKNVGVQIDPTRRNKKAGRIHHAGGAGPVEPVGDLDDLARLDADIGDPVDLVVGVDDRPAGDDEIERLTGRLSGKQMAGASGERQRRSPLLQKKPAGKHRRRRRAAGSGFRIFHGVNRG